VRRQRLIQAVSYSSELYVCVPTYIHSPISVAHFRSNIYLFVRTIWGGKQCVFSSHCQVSLEKEPYSCSTISQQYISICKNNMEYQTMCSLLKLPGLFCKRALLLIKGPVVNWGGNKMQAPQIARSLLKKCPISEHTHSSDEGLTPSNNLLLRKSYSIWLHIEYSYSTPIQTRSSLWGGCG